MKADKIPDKTVTIFEIGETPILVPCLERLASI